MVQQGAPLHHRAPSPAPQPPTDRHGGQSRAERIPPATTCYHLQGSPDSLEYSINFQPRRNQVSAQDPVGTSLPRSHAVLLRLSVSLWPLFTDTPSQSAVKSGLFNPTCQQVKSRYKPGRNSKNLVKTCENERQVRALGPTALGSNLSFDTSLGRT